MSANKIIYFLLTSIRGNGVLALISVRSRIRARTFLAIARIGARLQVRRLDFDMGYDLHITRKEYWADPEGPVISLSEWMAYLASDPEIVQDWENAGPENARFVTHPDQWPIWWGRGEIYTKNPDSLVIAKLVEIANRLGARVLGDDDEIYGLDPTDPTRSTPR